MVRPSPSPSPTGPRSRCAERATSTTRCSKPSTGTRSSRTPAPGSTKSPGYRTTEAGWNRRASRGQRRTAARATVRPGLRINRDAARARGPRAGATGWPALRRAPRAAQEPRRAAGHVEAVSAPPHAQTVGDFVGLCLLIDFSDEPGTITREQVHDFCNKPGYTGFGNNGSVPTFPRQLHRPAAGTRTS